MQRKVRKMDQKSNFLKETFRNIKTKLPTYVLRSISKLIPFYIVSSLFEIFGLITLIPVINVIIDPEVIRRNPYLHFLYERGGFQSHLKFATFLLCIATFIFILKNILLFFISKIQNNIIFELTRKLSFNKYNSYLDKDYDFHTENNSSVLLRNMTQIPFELVVYVIQPFALLLNEFFILFLIVLGVAIYDPLLFLTIFIFILPFVFLYNRLVRTRLHKLSKRRDAEGAKMYKMGLQSMENYREIIVSNKKDFFRPLFKKALDTFSHTMSAVSELNLATPRLVETVSVLSLFVIFMAGYLMGRDINTLAQFLVLFAIACYRMIPSINKIIQSSNFIKSSFYVFNYFNKSDFDNTPSGTQEKANTEKIIFKDKIELKDLSFQYKTQNYPVLDQLSLTIQKGDIIGVMGTSGSGKSTLLSILLRLYTEQSGGIFVDNIKIDQNNLLSWYRLLSFVPQNIVLLDGNIKENIAFGVPAKEVDEEKLNLVIQQAQLGDFVKTSPRGVLSEIGEKGIKISGGQRQRIGIARALYNNSEILIFDEATSALDMETEQMLSESIHHISKSNITMIIVAHRQETLKYCSKIYKIENGKAVEHSHTRN